MVVNSFVGREHVEGGSFQQDEIEMKFRLRDPKYFDDAREAISKDGGLVAITQLYLSNPAELGSLRLRAATRAEITKYSTTHKADAQLIFEGLKRRETEAGISEKAFEFYSDQDYARLIKQRAILASGVSIDFINGYDSPVLEIENLGTDPEAKKFYRDHLGVLVDHTGDPEVDNEWIAHHLSGKEGIPAKPIVSAEEIVAQAIAFKEALGKSYMVITISGRSGSGKSTTAQEVKKQLEDSHLFPRGIALLATDDYHRGKKWLEATNDGQPWVNWDDPIVYDTEALAKDTRALMDGHLIDARHFDFSTQEPTTKGKIINPNIVIIEGIHAGSKDFDGLRTLHYFIDTPLVESIGRDLDRVRSGDRANSSIGSPGDRLRYQIEYAEPTFQSLAQPKNARGQWSESVRRVAGRPIVPSQPRIQGPQG